MFKQVFSKTLLVSLIVGLGSGILINKQEITYADWFGFVSYRKAVIAYHFDDVMNSMRESIGKKGDYETQLNISSNNHRYKYQKTAREIFRDKKLKEVDQRSVRLNHYGISAISSNIDIIIYCCIYDME